MSLYIYIYILKSQVQLCQNTAVHFAAAECRGKGCLTRIGGQQEIQSSIMPMFNSMAEGFTH